MMITFYGYKRCSTSSKAEKYLTSLGKDYNFIDLTLSPPAMDELKIIISLSQKPINKFFNTNGVVYREMKLKDKIKLLTDVEKISLLASNGKLLKRPIVTSDTKSSVGFNQKEFQQIWS